MKNEIWMDIPHYEGLYQVSNFGRVKALERKRVNHTGGEWIQPECIMSISYTTDGYEKVSLTDANHNRKTERIHRLVALAFVPNPLNLPEVNHLNCVRDDNRPENLEWVTHAENNAYTSKCGHKSNKKIKCIETGEVFNTSVEAANVNGGDSGNIRTAARNPKRSVKGFHYTYID